MILEGGKITITTQTGDYTITLFDVNTLIEINSSAAHTVFIPTNEAVAFDKGVQFTLIQKGTGTVTIQAVDSGTTTIVSTASTSNTPVLRAQYSSATLIKSDTDSWYVIGDIA